MARRKVKAEAETSEADDADVAVIEDAPEATADTLEGVALTIAREFGLVRGIDDDVALANEALEVVAEQDLIPTARAIMRHTRVANESLCQAIESDERFIAVLAAERAA